VLGAILDRGTEVVVDEIPTAVALGDVDQVEIRPTHVLVAPVAARHLEASLQ
jgi:hypothetical protein